MADIIKFIKNLFMWGILGIYFLVVAAFYLLLALALLGAVLWVCMALWQVITKEIQQPILVAIVLVAALFALLHNSGSFFGKIADFLKVFACLCIIVLVYQSVLFLLDPGNRESAEHFFETNGTWVAADNSMRMHFFIEGAPESLMGFSAKTEVIVANLRTGSARRIPYSVAKQNNSLEFNTTWDNQTLPGDLPTKFLITNFSINSLVLQIQDQPPMQFLKVSRPNSLEELVDYSSNYSTEEYLSIIARESLFSDDQNTKWFYNPQMTFEKNPEDNYIITIKNIPLNTTDSPIHILRPGENSRIIIPPIIKATAPISDKIEAIYYTETISDSYGKTAIWTAKYNPATNSTQIISDTATGGWMTFIRH